MCLKNPDCFSNKNNIFCCSLLPLLLKKAVAPPAAVISSDPNPNDCKNADVTLLAPPTAYVNINSLPVAAASASLLKLSIFPS